MCEERVATVTASTESKCKKLLTYFEVYDICLLYTSPEGEICKLGQALTTRQALVKMVDKMAGDPGHQGKTLAITHCNCLERAFQVKDMVEAKCKFAQTIILEAGGITSVYANDGGIVTAY